jgi:hypothetical protein
MADEIRDAVYEGICRAEAAKEAAGDRRGYLGMSAIGNPCPRQPWYAWRDTTPLPLEGRVLLLFEHGRKIEELICTGLRAAGYQLEGAYPDQQIEYRAFGNFFVGHPDGLVALEHGKAVLEVKSANSSRFKMMMEKGVEAIYPQYYVQMQLYMHFSGLRQAVFVAMRKDDSAIYSEMITYDELAANALLEVAARIIRTHDPEGRFFIPPATGDDETCKWCRFRVHCQEPAEAIQTIRSCRSCSFLSIGDDFLPRCQHRAHPVALKRINDGCGDWSWFMRTPF